MRIVSDRRSKFAMTCVQCCNELIAPEWSVHRDGRHIVHFSALPAMRILFRGHFAYGHKVNRSYHGKDRKYTETTRRFAVAVGRIGTLSPFGQQKSPDLSLTFPFFRMTAGRRQDDSDRPRIQG